MKNLNRLAAALLSLILLLALLPGPAMAAQKMEPNRAVSLSVSCQEDGTPLVGVEFRIYLVATMDETGTLTPTAAFRPYLGDLSDDSWATKAPTLEGYVLLDKIAHTDAAKTDATGIAHFPSAGKNLTKGLYLVRGLRHTQGGKYYAPKPFLVLLPTLDSQSDTWVYDQAVSAKYTVQPVPDTPQTIKRKVLKVWKNGNHASAQPKSVTVYLLRDGEVVDTVILSDANNWRKTWDSLDSRCDWKVVEEPLSDYDTEVTQAGVTFVITNTRKQPPPPDENTPKPPPDTSTKPTTSSQDSGTNKRLPQTGQLWWPVPVLLCAGLILMIFGVIRRRKESDEAET